MLLNENIPWLKCQIRPVVCSLVCRYAFRFGDPVFMSNHHRWLVHVSINRRAQGWPQQTLARRGSWVLCPLLESYGDKKYKV